MWRLANGDATAIVDLYEHFRWKIDGAVRRRALARGYALHADDVEEITWSTCLLLARRASGWRPGSASPWTWAASAIDGLIAQYVGPPRARTSPIEMLVEFAARPMAEQPVTGNGRAMLRTLTINNELVALLDEAIELADTPRNAGVFVEHLVQQALGDPSPADTVGGLAGLRAPAVRQIVHRCRGRLRRLVETNQRFAPLTNLPLLQSARFQHRHEVSA